MPRGKQPVEYFSQPVVQKATEEIYVDFDSYTHEIFAEDAHANEIAWLKVVLPPLSYKGRRLKGLCFTPAADMLLEKVPAISELFITMATSMAISYPWSERSDAYLVSYANPERDRWFRSNASPSRREKILIPLGDADYVNELQMVPLTGVRRCVDVLVVSMPWSQKNIPLIVEAVDRFGQKFWEINMTWVVGKELDELAASEQEYMAFLRSLTTSHPERFDIVARVHPCLMNQFYARAKVYVLGSLFEGSNRSLKEAMSCNTPVICFDKYNHYARGTSPIFAQGAGLTADFSVDSLVECLHAILSEQTVLEPRAAFLRDLGRINFLNRCLALIPYYQANLPDLAISAQHNTWLREAVIANYGIDFESFLYGETDETGATGVDAVAKMIDRYLLNLGGKAQLD